jgi:hypothetical protein
MFGLITRKDKPVLQLSNNKWIRDNVFMVDIATYVLNAKLEEKDKFHCDMFPGV